ncbi:hypothetical protein MACH17_18290 [Phaeobacter inhibens]|nr:hypothetical protein MACH17_18290 [Phaeobacter inhibens]
MRAGCTRPDAHSHIVTMENTDDMEPEEIEGTIKRFESMIGWAFQMSNAQSNIIAYLADALIKDGTLDKDQTIQDLEDLKSGYADSQGATACFDRIIGVVRGEESGPPHLSLVPTDIHEP